MSSINCSNGKILVHTSKSHRTLVHTPLKWHRPHQKGQEPGAWFPGGLEQKWMEGHGNSFIVKSREHFVWKRSRRFKKGKGRKPIGSMEKWYICLHQCLIFLVNLGKCIRYMDPSWVCCFHIFLGMIHLMVMLLDHFIVVPWTKEFFPYLKHEQCFFFGWNFYIHVNPKQLNVTLPTFGYF